MSQQEQLDFGLIIPGQLASYWQLQAPEVIGKYTRQTHETVTMSPPAVEYLADAALRNVLHMQLKGNMSYAIVPIVNEDGTLRIANRVPRRSLVDIAEN